MDNFKTALLTGQNLEAFGFKKVFNPLETYIKDDVAVVYFDGELFTICIDDDSLFDLFNLDDDYPLADYIEDIPEVLEYLRKVVIA